MLLALAPAAAFGAELQDQIPSPPQPDALNALVRQLGGATDREVWSAASGRIACG